MDFPRFAKPEEKRGGAIVKTLSMVSEMIHFGLCEAPLWPPLANLAAVVRICFLTKGRCLQPGDTAVCSEDFGT